MFRKTNVSPLEAELQSIASNNYGFTPRIHSIEEDVVIMDKINGLCLAEKYTDDPKKIPMHIWQEIHRILLILFEREGIEYVDITSYNFMEDSEGKIWIIDFGHAYYTGKKEVNWFLKEFLDGDFGWNPDFA